MLFHEIHYWQHVTVSCVLGISTTWITETVLNNWTVEQPVSSADERRRVHVGRVEADHLWTTLNDAVLKEARQWLSKCLDLVLEDSNTIQCSRQLLHFIGNERLVKIVYLVQGILHWGAEVLYLRAATVILFTESKFIKIHVKNAHANLLSIHTCKISTTVSR